MSEPTSDVPASQKKPPCCRCRPAVLAAVLVIAAGAGIALYARWGGSPVKEEPLPDAGADSAPSQSPAEGDSRFRRMVIGTWQDEYQGKRTMILNEDGSGTMAVELSGWRAVLSAPRLRFDMVWSVEGGHLKKRTVGGEPATQVQIILKTMGDRVDEPILELTDDRLLLLDKDGKTRYDWRRAEK